MEHLQEDLEMMTKHLYYGPSDIFNPMGLYTIRYDAYEKK